MGRRTRRYYPVWVSGPQAISPCTMGRTRFSGGTAQVFTAETFHVSSIQKLPFECIPVLLPHTFPTTDPTMQCLILAHVCDSRNWSLANGASNCPAHRLLDAQDAPTSRVEGEPHLVNQIFVDNPLAAAIVETPYEPPRDAGRPLRKSMCVCLWHNCQPLAAPSSASAERCARV